MKKPHLPLGYWLKRADNLITEQVNQVQAANGVTRTDWQVLNTLYEVGSADQAQLFTVMHTFVDAAQLEQILGELKSRGWVTAVENGVIIYQLSNAGQQQHSQILAAQQEVRQQVMQGISQEEFATVMRVLQQMVANLETAVSEGNHHGK
jgi:DNA-binding MarR family transcriptional regulator